MDRMASDTSQRGNPTFAPDVARQALRLLDADVRGTFNVVAHGAASRFDYVSRIVALSGLPCEVEPGPAFQRQAAVSSNEAALNYRLGIMRLDIMPPWSESLAHYVCELMKTPQWRALAF